MHNPKSYAVRKPSTHTFKVPYMRQRTQHIIPRIILVLFNKVSLLRLLLRLYLLFSATVKGAVRLVQDPGTDTRRKLLQTREQIPNLTLLNLTDIRHEIRNIAS